MSRQATCPSARPRITIIEDCAPQFPPVSISMGMKAASATADCSTDSNPVMMRPVMVADTISTISHTMRLRNISKGLVLRYSFSEGAMAAIFSMSSVFSCWMTSMMSSTVIRPTRRPSPSTTGNSDRS